MKKVDSDIGYISSEYKYGVWNILLSFGRSSNSFASFFLGP